MQVNPLKNRSRSALLLLLLLNVFVRAEIIRPEETLLGLQQNLKRISDRNREAFEAHEREFQDYETWPGIQPKPTAPEKVLDTH